MKKNINIESTRRLALVTPNLITHFCRSAARLNGMLALREQFNEEHLDGACSSIAMAEVDSEELRQKIVKCARDCANSLFRMNQQAKKHNIAEPLYCVDEMGLADVVDSVRQYVTELVGESDFREWVDKYDKE